MSCILPCGSLDVIRIVHLNGKVEEISHGVRAGEVLKAYPKHVLRKPPSAEEFQGRSGAVVVPATAQLQKGTIYFLVPVSSPEKTKGKKKKKRDLKSHVRPNDLESLLLFDRYLSDILSEKVSSEKERRRGRVGVWRPHLESISEVCNDL